MWLAGGAHRVDRDLYVAAGAIFEAHWHRESRSELAMYLALCGACPDSGPCNGVGDELGNNGIEKFGAGGQAEFTDVD